jgi:hypothetical protein
MTTLIKEIREEIEKTECQIQYVYRTIHSCVGIGCINLFRELEELYLKKKRLQEQLNNLCKSGENF